MRNFIPANMNDRRREHLANLVEKRLYKLVILLVPDTNIRTVYGRRVLLFRFKNGGKFFFRRQKRTMPQEIKLRNDFHVTLFCKSNNILHIRTICIEGVGKPFYALERIIPFKI